MDVFERGGEVLVKALLFLEPLFKGGVLFSEGEGFGKFRVVPVLTAGAIALEDEFGFFAVHGVSGKIFVGAPTTGPTFSPVSRSSRRSAFPRAMRDMTVPMGMSRMAAISL